ncbi:MAG: ABC transporter substrate-binding protein [Beijerinckiaceae bacterium]
MKTTRRTFLSGLAAAGATPLISFPVRAQEKTLRVRFYDDPAGFDPANIFRVENENIAFNLFSGLTTYESKSGKIIPDLAESWETKDNITWVFKLRRGVKWQKGYGDFTSADVVYSYQRILDPATASPYRNEFAGVKKIEAPDDYTVVITLDSPDGNFLHQVANYHQGQIVNKKAIEAAGKQVRWQPVGTGPYYLDSIDVNSRIVLKRHEEYFRGPAPISTIIFQIIKDESTGTIALRRGEVDLVMRSNREENIAILQKEGFVMNKTEDYATAMKVFNLSVKPLSDVRVRRAIAHALDYDAIIKATSPILQKTSLSLLQPWMDVYSADVPRYPYNPGVAKKLLAEAGYAKGFSFKNLSTSAQGVTEFQQFEIDFLSQVGVKMEMELVDTPTFNQRRNRGDFEVTTRLIPAVNPDTLLFSFLDPANISPKGMNGARYDNPEVTQTLRAAKAEMDPVKRKALYAKVQQLAMRDLPYLPQYSNGVIWPGKKNVVGVQPNYLAQVNFFEVDIK